MADFANMARQFSKIERLEHELHLRQLQVNRLLTLTQAINNNFPAAELFAMYHSFLTFELGIKKMALYVHGETEVKWVCTAQTGLTKAQKKYNIGSELADFRELVNLDAKDHPFLCAFELVIPVLHKKQPIAYVFIGGFDDDDDMYEKVQFITTITNIVAVAIENKRLFKRQLEQERLRREMELAGEMQRMLIPASLPVKDCYEMASIYKPHFGVGGDYYDYLEFPDGKLAFCIGDISGKGVAAALLMANFQANFNTLINKRTPLKEFIIDLNTSVNRITGGDRFITFFVAEFDRYTNVLRYINAGHNPPILASEDQTVLLKEGCTILGSFQELPEIGVGEVQLTQPSLILTYTDGLIDIQNAQGDYFDDLLLKQFVEKHHHLSAAEFNHELQQALNTFKGEEGYPDDFTVLTSRFVPVENPC
ncbi:MAG: SpoIIE family protein phosphatase [Lewinella sp.]|jgi:sigma-B regulation protein RsbU (phosphoserine phosphatase)|uniref:PP2C family protein-serine/threonine phosphatase n=1 Tax=Lewinella sp. TaxID=2004506 RepID=UPI003D6AD496